MAKIIVEKNPYRIKLPGQIGNIIKTMDAEFEPPKDYLWSTPTGDLYVWYCDEWVLVDYFLEHPYYSCTFDMDCDELDNHLRSFETDIMKKVAKYVSEHSGTNIEVENRLSALESIDYSQFVTAEDE